MLKAMRRLCTGAAGAHVEAAGGASAKAEAPRCCCCCPCMSQVSRGNEKSGLTVSRCYQMPVMHLQELPAHLWTLLGAPAQQLKLRMLTVSVSSDADLAALRQHVAGTVDYIQHGEDHRGLSAAF